MRLTAAGIGLCFFGQLPPQREGRVRVELQRAFGFLGLFVFSMLAACSEDPENPGGNAVDGSVANRDGGVAGDATGPATDAAARVDAGVVLPPPTCASGAPVPEIIGTASPENCAGRLAERTFRYAVCSCSDISGNSDLFFDAFDSRSAPYSGAMGEGAAVGANGEVSLNAGDLTVGGTLRAGGLVRTNGGDVTVAGDLFVGGDLRTNAGTYRVRRDAWVTGDIDTDLVVDRNLTHGGDLDTASRSVMVQGTTAMAGVTVDPPCPCGASDLIDVSALVAEAETNNDNDALGIAQDDLRTSRDDVELPCGRIFLTSIGFSSRRIVTRGRTMVFVRGNVSANSMGFFGAEDGGELDVFIDGDLTMNGRNVVGHELRPANVRIYVSGRVILNGSNTIAANLYAPNSLLNLNSGNEVFGSVFVGELSSNSESRFHYDRAVIDAGDACTTPPGQCNGCEDCSGGQTCLNAMCQACGSDADCCAPLVCNPDGSCGVLLF